MLNRTPKVDLLADEAAADPGALRFREAMSRVAGAVHVVTTDGPAGRAGLTATAVAPVTDSPGTVLACLNVAARSAAAVTANGVFCVNVLPESEVEIADAFAGRSALGGRRRFELGTWTSLATGAPALATALAAFDCRLDEARRVGTHLVLLGTVVEVKLGPAATPLVYWDRRYHGL